MAEEKKIEAEEIKNEAEEKKIEAKEKNKDIKPWWVPWVIIGAELVIVLGIGVLACLAALA